MFIVTHVKTSAMVQISIRFTEKLYDQLKLLAAHYSVSFNSLVLQAIMYALENLQPCDKNMLQ